MSFNKDFLGYLFGNKKGNPYKLPPTLQWESLKFEEKLLYSSLANFLLDYVLTLDFDSLDQSQIYHLLNYEEFLPKDLLLKFKEQSSEIKKAQSSSALTESQLQELIDFKVDDVSIIAIFKKHRRSPGKLFIRLKDGTFLRDKNNKVWSLKVLAKSSRGLPFHCTNGQTPTGVLKINSVMPEANNVLEYGYNRRLKIYYLENQKELLPPSHYCLDYWKQVEVAKKLGRSLFRIHGTGVNNNHIFSPSFPMVASSGCLTMRERRLFGLKLMDDQRKLLDKLMDSQGLLPLNENESKIQAYLYVVDFGGKFQNIQFK